MQRLTRQLVIDIDGIMSYCVVLRSVGCAHATSIPFLSKANRRVGKVFNVQLNYSAGFFSLGSNVQASDSPAFKGTNGCPSKYSKALGTV